MKGGRGKEGGRSVGWVREFKRSRGNLIAVIVHRHESVQCAMGAGNGDVLYTICVGAHRNLAQFFLLCPMPICKCALVFAASLFDYDL